MKIPTISECYFDSYMAGTIICWPPDAEEGSPWGMSETGSKAEAYFELLKSIELHFDGRLSADEAISLDHFLRFAGEAVAA